ncbi:MAG: bifunctional (p)ppGpp synthetase/guanosine-3',5'-bis(diphosphate) 3'-pyrophosphohydrolase, partial [Firmicutes bacterium]|nr:bifunctional (p)ppGpp synthetase/guanosine-3',5'-bis(diphosphate) 3'-pyrophosphohydrolase [Bacillota bacterium]
PLEAGIIVAQTLFDEELVSAAILHDTMEDAGVSYETLETVFSPKVAALVRIQTQPDGEWIERRQRFLSLLPERDLKTKIVILGDKLSNMRAIHRDYGAIGDELWQRFSQKDKSQQKWYYQGLVKGLESLERFPAYQEFRTKVFDVFGN